MNSAGRLHSSTDDYSSRAASKPPCSCIYTFDETIFHTRRTGCHLGLLAVLYHKMFAESVLTTARCVGGLQKFVESVLMPAKAVGSL